MSPVTRRVRGGPLPPWTPRLGQYTHEEMMIGSFEAIWDQIP